MKYQYALVIWYSQQDEAYLVEVPEVPGCMADGESQEEAVQSAQTAIRLWIEGARKMGRPVPRPARVRDAALKPLLATVARRARPERRKKRHPLHRRQEGRRARHGAAMAGPDYTWWHGLYEVSKVFYTDFIPQARALDSKIVDDTINSMPEHDWFTKGMTKEQIQQILDFHKSRYGQ